MEQQDFDVVVVGSGAGALLAAIRAADEGLKALVVEKMPQLGGTSATSGGGIWIPDNHDMPKAGLRDSVQAFHNQRWTLDPEHKRIDATTV